MSKNRLKLLLWFAALLLLMLAAVAVVRGLSALEAHFRRGADPASALNIVPNQPPELHVAVDWLPDDPDTGRPMDPFTRSRLESAYLSAWLQWNLALSRGADYGLRTYFSGAGLAAVRAAAEAAGRDGVRVDRADLSHLLRLHMLSADGQIVAFSDETVRVAHRVVDAEGEVIDAGELRERYDVVMLLEDGNWRVRHLARRAGEPVGLGEEAESREGSAAGVGRPEAEPAPGPAPQGLVRRDGRGLVVAGEPLRVAGLNYYPARRPWRKFWTDYDPVAVDADLRRMRALGLNTARVFLPFDTFGGARPDPDRLRDLEHLLARAQERRMHLVVTLFDLHADYRPLAWPAADRHLASIVPRLADHPALLAWDLKNEADLDYGRWGRETVDAWLGHVAREIRRHDPHHLITVGWSSPEAATSLGGTLDLLSFHFYSPAEELPERVADLREREPDLPLLLGEFGLSTWNPWYWPGGHSEGEQAAYYGALLWQLEKLDAAGYLAWTLHDFEHVPREASGGRPWVAARERRMGVLRPDGSARPAAAWLAVDVSRPEAPPRWPLWRRPLKPFWLAAAALVLLLALGRWRRPSSRRPTGRGGVRGSSLE